MNLYIKSHQSVLNCWNNLVADYTRIKCDLLVSGRTLDSSCKNLSDLGISLPSFLLATGPG